MQSEVSGLLNKKMLKSTQSWGREGGRYICKELREGAGGKYDQNALYETPKELKVF